MQRLFVPGFGAPAGLYRRLLADEWTVLAPPPFRSLDTGLPSYVAWLEDELDRRADSVWLAGHSMGGALALLVAAARPRRFARLTLISPAGLPLDKPIGASVRALLGQVGSGRYRAIDAATAFGRMVAAPRNALRLAREVRSLDLVVEMEAIRRAGVPVDVVACSTDTLVTPAHCRRQARLLGARYRQLPLAGGHMWMLGQADQLAAVLRAR